MMMVSLLLVGETPGGVSLVSESGLVELISRLFFGGREGNASDTVTRMYL
jgi:hypothetical protein